MMIHWPPRWTRGWETLFTVLVIVLAALAVAWTGGWL